MVNRNSFSTVCRAFYWVALIPSVLSLAIQAKAVAPETDPESIEHGAFNSTLNTEEDLGDVVFAVRKLVEDEHWYANFGV